MYISQNQTADLPTINIFSTITIKAKHDCSSPEVQTIISLILLVFMIKLARTF